MYVERLWALKTFPEFIDMMIVNVWVQETRMTCMSLQSIYCIRHCALRISYAFWSSLISIELPCRADLNRLHSTHPSLLRTTTLILVLVVPMVVSPLTRCGDGVIPPSSSNPALLDIKLFVLSTSISPRAEKREGQMMEIKGTEQFSVVIVVSLLLGLQLMFYAYDSQI